MRFYNCLLIRWLSTMSILLVIERIYRYQLESNYLKNHELFTPFLPFLIFLASKLNFQRSQKKWASKAKHFSSYWLQKMRLFECIIGVVPENPLVLNVLRSPENSWNLQKGNSKLLFLYSEPNWIRRSYFQSDLRFQIELEKVIFNHIWDIRSAW